MFKAFWLVRPFLYFCMKGLALGDVIIDGTMTLAITTLQWCLFFLLATGVKVVKNIEENSVAINKGGKAINGALWWGLTV